MAQLPGDPPPHDLVGGALPSTAPQREHALHTYLFLVAQSGRELVPSSSATSSIAASLRLWPIWSAIGRQPNLFSGNIQISANGFPRGRDVLGTTH